MDNGACLQQASLPRLHNTVWVTGLIRSNAADQNSRGWRCTWQCIILQLCLGRGKQGLAWQDKEVTKAANPLFGPHLRWKCQPPTCKCFNKSFVEFHIAVSCQLILIRLPVVCSNDSLHSLYCLLHSFAKLFHPSL